MDHILRRKYEFGVFRFDATGAELLRNGYVIRIPEQSRRILGFLLERAGTVVTREELRDLLWTNDEYVDYDHSISNSISRLRAAFRDDIRTPTYIATISKRGYRFIAPVKLVEKENPPSISAAATSPATFTTSVSELGLSPELAPDDGLPTVDEPVSSSHRLKWLRPVWLIAAAFVLVVSLAGIWKWYPWRSEYQVAPELYLGIAPFTVSSGGRTLADSFRMDLADSLSLLPGVQVLAANSFPSGQLDEAGIRQLGEQAHLDVVLLSRFTQSDRNCTLEFELVRARDAAHLGSFHYSGSIDDLSSIRDRVQREVFARLDLVRYATRPMAAPATEPRAYELYLRARYDLMQQNKESLTRAIDEFSTVVSIDPHYAKAYSGMANAYVTLADHDDVLMEEGYRQAMELARKAIAVDPNVAEGHALLGYSSLGPNWNLTLAEQEMRKAIELDPNSARYHLWLSVLLAEEARFDEAYHQIDLAHAADPFWPANYVTEAFVASAARDNQHMLDAGSKMAKLKPDWPLSYEELGWIYWYMGEHEKAAHSWLTMAQLDQDPQRIDLEQRGLDALAHGGFAAYAQLRLRAIKANSDWKHPYHDFFLPEWYSCAGEKDKALEELEKIVAHHDVGSMVIAVNPLYDSFRGDSRFKQILASIYGAANAANIENRLNARLAASHSLNLACPVNSREATGTLHLVQ